MQKLILSGIFLFLIVFPSYAFADGPYLNIPPTNAFDKIRTDSGSISAVNFSMPLKITGGTGVTVSANNGTHTVTITNTQSVNTHSGTYNQTYANNVLVNSGGHRLNFINGTNSTISLVNDPSRNQINITISSTGGGGGGSGVSSVNALSGALTIACVAGNTTCTTSGGNTITINTAYNIATLNLNEIFSGITTMNNLKLGGQMNINGQTMQSFGHVYSWQNHTGTVCLTNQTTSCGPAGSATYDTLVNIGTGEASVYAGNTTKTNFTFKTLKQGSHITLTNNTNDVTIATTGLLSSAITSVNSQTGPSITITRQPSYTTITNSTNNIKVGIDATGVMELNGTQTVTGAKTHSADLIMSGANINLGTNGLTNSGHKSTLPLTSGILCQTNQTTSCGTNSGVTSITGTAHNVTASSSTGAVTLNTGDGVFMTGLSPQIITKNVTFSGPLMNIQSSALSGNITPVATDTNIMLTGDSSHSRRLELNAVGVGYSEMFRRADGTITSPTPVQTGEQLGAFIFRGSGANGNWGSNNVASLFVIGTDNFNSTSQPTRFVFQTTPTGSTSAVNRLLINQYGGINLAANTDPTSPAGNDIWYSSTTTDVIKYRGASSTYSLVSTLSATNATRGQLSGNGTGTSSASMVMDGVYATITPANTGRITVHVTGDAADSVISDGCNIGIRQSTSNMGGNGAVVAGSLLGDTIKTNSAAAAQITPFSRIYDFSGTVGTKYFFDLAFSRVTGGTCTITSVNWDLVEH